MTPIEFSTVVGAAIKFPFFIVFKLIIAVLNIIRLQVYEVHGVRGHTSENRPDLRDSLIVIKGKRRLHLGSFLIAWQRGAVFVAHVNSHSEKVWGIWPEDYDKIQKKWAF